MTMDWWRRLRSNSLARLGALLLACFYLMVIFADILAPYDPYSSQADGSLLPPTQIHWRSPAGEWQGPTVYPTRQLATDLATGKRPLAVDFSQPAPVRFWVQGDPYQWGKIRLPLPPSFEAVTLFPGIKGDRHLIGTTGSAKLNLLGTDEQGRDQLSRLLYGGRISLFIGLVGITISFPLGMIVGGVAGYFGGWLDAVLMRLVEVLMTIPGIYLLIALAAVLPPA